MSEKKGTEYTKVDAADAKGGLKWSSNTDDSSARSAKLSKGVVPHTIASAAAARITPVACGLTNVLNAPGSKIVSGAKKVAPFAKKCIVSAIGALAMISTEGTQESSPHDQALEVQLKAELCGRSSELRVQSLTTSVPRSNPETFLHIAASLGAAGASTGCLELLEIACAFVLRDSNPLLMLVLDVDDANVGALVVNRSARGDDVTLLSFLEHVSYAKVFLFFITIICLIF
jgi:hypothetical protein